MDIAKFWYIIGFSIFLLQVVDLKYTNYVMKKSWKFKEPNDINSKGRPEDDFIVYKGFANNPFGPSTRFIYNGNMTANFTFPPPISSTSSTIYSSLSKNVVDEEDEQVKNKTEGRSKRGVLHLYNMVKCATGCDPLSYKGYGCFCGFLGRGQPVDSIDRCCKKHDWCYVNAGCPLFFEYLVPYYWKCYRNRPLCAVEHGEWGGRNSCARRLCECDRVLSECLSRYPCPKTRVFCHSSPWRLLQNAFMIL